MASVMKRFPHLQHLGRLLALLDQSDLRFAVSLGVSDESRDLLHLLLLKYIGLRADP